MKQHRDILIMSKVISLITGKGGAGKSTIAFNLSGALAEKKTKLS